MPKKSNNFSILAAARNEFVLPSLPPPPPQKKNATGVFWIKKVAALVDFAVEALCPKIWYKNKYQSN